MVLFLLTDHYTLSMNLSELKDLLEILIQGMMFAQWLWGRYKEEQQQKKMKNKKEDDALRIIFFHLQAIHNNKHRSQATK